MQNSFPTPYPELNTVLQHLEGSYFPKAVLRSIAHRGTKLWYLDNGARSLIQSAHCNTTLVRWVVRECGVTLSGPSPSTLIDPIAVESLRMEIREVIGEIPCYVQG